MKCSAGWIQELQVPGLKQATAEIEKIQHPFIEQQFHYAQSSLEMTGKKKKSQENTKNGTVNAIMAKLPLDWRTPCMHFCPDPAAFGNKNRIYFLMHSNILSIRGTSKVIVKNNQPKLKPN